MTLKSNYFARRTLRLTQRITCFFIVILLLIPFQLSSLVFAGQRIPLLILPDQNGKPIETVMQALDASGYQSYVIHSDDLLLGASTQQSRYILVPLGGELSERALGALARYVAAGGSLVLFPTGAPLTLSDDALCRLIGVSVTGQFSPKQSVSFRWNDAQLPNDAVNTLSPSDSILSVYPEGKAQVLATWGNLAPALVKTPQGALINWQWGQQLSSTMNTIALSKVTPLETFVTAARNTTSADAQPPVQLSNASTTPQALIPTPASVAGVAMLASSPGEHAESTHAKPMDVAETDAFFEQFSHSDPDAFKLSQAPVDTTLPLPSSSKDANARTTTSPVATSSHEASEHSASPFENLAMLAASAKAAPKASKSSTAKPDSKKKKAPQKSGAGHSSSKTSKPTATQSSSSAAKAVASKPAQEMPKSSTANADAVSNPAKKSSSAASPTDSEAEVINNILGAPVVPEAPAAAKPSALPPSQSTTVPTADPNAAQSIPSTAPSTVPAGALASPPAVQKHFSFLDADAASVLAPEFDYGVYSLSLRILDDYRRRVNNAREEARQLALEIPAEITQKVDTMLMEAQTHKKRFENLYLGNQTQEGLNEFGQSKRLLLKALALYSQSPKVEGRAIWLDRSTIIDAGNPEGVKKLMQKLHRAGINIVYFETLNAGFPIYPSKLLKNNPLVKNWDPLASAVQEGHRLGMEVHAWVWVFAVGNRRHNPLVGMPDTYPGPILSDAGLMSEALRNRDGGLSVDTRQNEFWLSPASPKARDFLLSVYKEIVSNYDVDGIHLDYIRYPFQTGGTRMGFDPVSRERFTQSTGRSLDTLDDYTSRLWVAWKTYQVSSFVQAVSENLRRIKPDLKISAAVFPMRRDARIVAIQQDWETWINNGWIDMLSPMSYSTDPERVQSLFEFVQTSPQKRPLIYPGVALNRIDGAQLVFQLEGLREKGSLGSTLFAGAHLDADKLEALANGPFKHHATLPPHRDTLRSLQALMTEYQQTFDRLASLPKANQLSIETQQAAPIREALKTFTETLTAIGPVKTVSEIPPFKLQAAQQQFKILQDTTHSWLQGDQANHALRAQYFENKLTLLSELLGYLADKNASVLTGASGSAAFSPTSVAPTASVPAATPASVEKTTSSPTPTQTPSAVGQETSHSADLNAALSAKPSTSTTGPAHSSSLDTGLDESALK